MSADKDDRDLLDVPVLGHLGVVVVDGVEGGLVLETEDEDDSVHPSSKLKKTEIEENAFLECVHVSPGVQEALLRP